MKKFHEYALPHIPYDKASKKYNYALQSYPDIIVTFIVDNNLKNTEYTLVYTFTLDMDI